MIEAEHAAALVRSLRHDRSEPIALGCSGCPDLEPCGGMQVSAPLFNCMAHCNCEDYSKCSVVCPNNSSFVARIHEVRGLGFDDIERKRAIPLPVLPTYAHLLYRCPQVAQAINLPIAAVPLSAVFKKSGKGATALTRQELEQKFCLAPNTPLIFSGVELDHKIEKYWGVSRGRENLLAGIKALKPQIVTTPNYSVVLDAPRHDAMHSLKRILLAWSELHDAGIPTALHINAVTDRDYERVIEFLRIHSEIKAVSVEFETGAATESQGLHHANQLDRLVQALGYAPHMVFRGDARWLPVLLKTFPSLTILNGSADVRTRKRRRAALEAGQIEWKSWPTLPGAPLDELLAHNLSCVGEWLERKTADAGLMYGAPLLSQRVRKVIPLKIDTERHHKSPQMSLL